MSMPTSTMKAVAVGGIALSTVALGVVAANAAPSSLPVLASATDDTADSDDTTDDVAADAGRGHRPGGMRGEHTAALAEKLGVEESALEDAMATLRENRGEEGRAAMASALAEALGIDEQTVTTAMEEMRTERQAEARTAFGERLDEAVADGTLTAADKESVLKAFDAGLLGRGPGGRH